MGFFHTEIYIGFRRVDVRNGELRAVRHALGRALYKNKRALLEPKVHCDF